MLIAIVLLVADLLFAVTGQLLLKQAVSAQGEARLSLPDLLSFFWGVLSRWHVWAALACYGAAFLLWLVVLSRIRLSLAYPFTSLMYVFILLASWYFLHERISLAQMAGIGFILIGLFFVTRAA